MSIELTQGSVPNVSHDHEDGAHNERGKSPGRIQHRVPDKLTSTVVYDNVDCCVQVHYNDLTRLQGRKSDESGGKGGQFDHVIIFSVVGSVPEKMTSLGADAKHDVTA